MELTMGQLFAAIFAPAIALFLGGMALARAFGDRKADAALEPLAGLFDPGSARHCAPPFFSLAVARRVLAGTRGGRELELWVEGPKHRRGGGYSMYGYACEVTLAASCPFSFRAGRADRLTDAGAGIGLLQDLQVGEPELDKVLRLSCSDPAAFALLAQRREFRDALREAAAMATFADLSGDAKGLRLLRRHDARGPLIDLSSTSRVVSILERVREVLPAA